MALSRLSPHFAAISPYFNVFKQPTIARSDKVLAAAYLSRHGIIEVSSYDYHKYISPFLLRLKDIQQAGHLRFTGPLSFLNTYESWITEAHVGGLSDYGRHQCYDLGSAIRIRYQQFMRKRNAPQGGLPFGNTAKMTILSDSAARCQLSAREFARSFAEGRDAQAINVSVVVINPEKETDPRKNLSWHTTYQEVDQTHGQAWMEDRMTETTIAALSRLKHFWPGQLKPKDIYAMQLLHCYDICSGRTSPWMEPTELFTMRDWEGFEYLRDGKYYFSEGRGARNATARYALPWLVSAVHHLKTFKNQHENSPEFTTDVGPRCTTISHGNPSQAQFSEPSINNESGKPTFPLQICFTHREEILYLCSLLGFGCYIRKSSTQRNLEAWKPSTFLNDSTTSRPWHVSTMACYLGHVGIEAYIVQEVGKEYDLTRVLRRLTTHSSRQAKGEEVRVRIVLNGTIVHEVFPDEPNLRPYGDGGYRWEVFEKLVYERQKRWEDDPPAGLRNSSCVWQPPRHSTG